MKLHALCLLAALVLPAASLAADAPLPGDSVYQFDAQLTDQDGKELEWKDLRGGPKLVSMFYTNCHLMCPLIIESGKAVQKQLPAGDRAKLGLVMVSLDPERDTPAALAATARAHRVDDAQWRLVQPRPGDVRALAGLLDIRYRAQDDGTFNHTSALILLDADGRILARTEVDGIQPNPVFVAQVKQALASHP